MNYNPMELVPYQDIKKIQRIRKQATKSVFPKNLQYFTLTIHNRAGSKFSEDAYYISPPDIFLEFNVRLLKYFAWLFCR